MKFLSRKAQQDKKQKEFLDEAIPNMNLLYNFARHLTGNADDADDLLQDTFLKAYRFWDSYEKGTNIRAWLFRIMKNSYINKYRKDSKEPEVVDFDEIEEFFTSSQTEIATEDDLAKKIFSNLFEDEVQRAIDELPIDFKTVIILCDIEGFTYEEIAEFLDIPIGTVRSRLHRARKMLQSKLVEYAKKKGIIK
ncbi:MAG: RNA polymerase sigma-70 factor, ECF subfamily [Ignavibacteriae bacterium]|nr:MAG: RNA polymerase sigma-70 factor, ECF subfamily [Ignavibacteriota bacterium]